MELLAATIRHAATNKAAGFQCREENPRWADPPLGFSYPTAEGKASHGRVWASLGSYKPSALPSPPSASPQPRLGTRRTRCTRPSQQALEEGAHEYLRYLEQKQKVKDRAFGFVCFKGNLKSKTLLRSGSPSTEGFVCGWERRCHRHLQPRFSPKRGLSDRQGML